MAGIAGPWAKIAHGDDAAVALAHAAVTFAPPWSLARHSHTHHEMLIVETGRHVTLTDAGEWVSEPGDILCFAPGVAHAERVERKTAWLVVSFRLGGPHGAGDPRGAGDPHGAGGPPLRGRDDTGRVRTLARWMAAEGESLSPGREEVRRAFLRALLAEYRESFATRADPLVDRVRRAMRDGLARPLTLEDLARAGGYSKFAFVREYARRTGLTPMADLRRLRLDKARELLLHSERPIKAVGLACGLGDAHAFTRAFRRRFGFPPGAYRARSRV